MSHSFLLTFQRCTVQYLCLTAPNFAFAKPYLTLLYRCDALPRFALAEPHYAIRYSTFAEPHYALHLSMPLLHLTSPYFAFTKRDYALPLQCVTMLHLCLALPYCTARNLCYAKRSTTSPSRYGVSKIKTTLTTVGPLPETFELTIG